ncbi:glucomannan 4-beta-mannosyltransferase 9-like isoform X1 [Papaver somniferum]|uniref:glucomannan 4-beta-mannosyltransferase 9-like isoform X1 n=1 Tax=Papaver somniferum TaxID=3469 RepID=UPI000E6FBB2D|nr:glucomannan 4-beta-mannosyltransferase 9-like isoform X1 [Papaver somniferum]
MRLLKKEIFDEWVPLITSFVPETLLELSKNELTEELSLVWNILRSSFIAPVLRILVYTCLVMSIMLFTERLYMSLIILYVKLFGRKPEKRYKWKPITDVDGNNGGGDSSSDVEKGTSSDYPMVLVQIPMYNEKEVYKMSIGAACGLSWPPDRIIIQVLDDSTDPIVKDLVQIECQKWADEGINIKYEIRDNRNGYKAGALKEGFKCSYVEACDFVTIFDADFQPDPDFLHKTIPYFIHNPEIGLVQARWEFTNARECIMTRIQQVSLNFHFKVEQEVGSFTYAFFGFNGTAGVWRIAAINEAGGWNGRTTVEDMDLSVRASLKGWKFVYVSDIRVKCELPSTFKAFRYQQHRWSCGPANLFRKMFMEIIRSEKVSLWKKIHVIYSFFLVRKIIAHIVTFSFYCVIIPTCVLFPEVVIPKWGAVYIPSAITILNAVETPRSIHLLVYWILFETVMAMHRSKGTVIGLLETDRVNEWVVTEKLGDALLKSKSSDNLPIKPSEKPPLLERIYLMELFMGGYIFLCGCYDVAFGKNWFFIYLYAQAMAYFITGLGYVGTRKPNS